MKTMDIEKTLGYVLAWSCLALTLASQFFSFILKDKEMSFIVIAIGIFTPLVAYIYFSVRDIASKLEHENKSSSGCIYKNEGISLVTDPQNHPDIFQGFTDVYHAYNAPLRFENADLNYHASLHASRYKNQNFKRANYYYPALENLRGKELRIWVINIYSFYKSLQPLMSDEEKCKLYFFLPDKTKSNDEKNESIITYFMGTKNNKLTCITYIHSPAFTVNNLPYFMVVFTDPSALRHIKIHIDSSQTELVPIRGVDSFLIYLEETYPEICSKAKALLES